MLIIKTCAFLGWSSLISDPISKQNVLLKANKYFELFSVLNFADFNGNV